MAEGECGLSRIDIQDNSIINAQILKLKVRNRPFYNFFKRFFDLTLSVTLLIITFPILCAIGIAIKHESEGPIFYLGKRIGLNGVSFFIFKFRTMYLGADLGASTTSRNDPRVTRIGRPLRRFKLDELPQLFNVIIGNMSFVGPRPELAKYVSEYKGLEKLILEAKPGITDLASLEFYNLNTLIDDKDPDGSFESKVLSRKNSLRIYYVINRTFALDMMIIVKTFFKLFRL